MVHSHNSLRTVASSSYVNKLLIEILKILFYNNLVTSNLFQEVDTPVIASIIDQLII